MLVSANPETKGQETRLALSARPPDIEGGPLMLSGAPADGLRDLIARVEPGVRGRVDVR